MALGGMNQGEADRCIEIAKTAMADGDWDKALRLLDKSLRFKPDNNAEAHVLKHKATAMKGASSAPRQAATPVRRQSPGTPTSAPAREFTPEQADMVRQIKRAGKDYYKILGIQRSCEDSALKKAYRKLAVKLHPDKNSAPGADEAFKAVGTAYACLSDGQKRAHYDRFGSEQPVGMSSSGGRRHSMYADEINPEDIFNMFFGMQPQRGHQRQRQPPPHARQQQGQAQHRQAEGGFGNLVQLMPLLLLFLFSFLGNTSRAEVPFRLRSEGNFQFRRETQQTQVSYYVDAQFERTYKTRQMVLKVEKEVDKYYINNMMNKCRQEKIEQRQLVQEARWYRGQEKARLIQRAERMKLSACVELQQQGYKV